jgi:hypothetical protein
MNPYIPLPYPAWRYHREHSPLIVQNEDEDRALGEGWAASPAAFKTAPSEPEQTPDEPEIAEAPRVKRCKVCRETGHDARNCPKLKR